MDFTPSPEAAEAAALTAEILRDQVTPERQRAATDRFDAGLWAALGDAGLVGLAVPEEFGGAGLGLAELCSVLVEIGHVVAPVPLATHGACAAFLADHAGPDVRRDWLPGAADGSGLLAAAVAEPLEQVPAHPAVTATADGRLDGVKVLVRGALPAAAFLVTATGPAGPTAYLVEVHAAGLALASQRTSDGEPTGLLTLAGTPGTAVGPAAPLVDLLTVCACAELLGVTEGALRLTADYASHREQFRTPIGTFQAVRHRLADGHIDVLGQRLTLWRAVWRVAEGLPAAVEVAVAKLWAADAAHRVAHSAVHIHGGVGIDLDGDTHRFFTAAKRHEFEFGPATQRALEIGRHLAAEAASA